MSDYIIDIKFPTESYNLYGNSLNFRYTINNNIQNTNIYKVVLSLDGNSEIEIDLFDKGYNFTFLSAGSHVLTGYIKRIKTGKIENSDFKVTFNVVGEKYNPESPTWFLIKEKIPQFIREDHKLFTRFVEAYYEWLDKSNNPVYSQFSLENISDVDTTPDIFLDTFRTQYLNDFPKSISDISELNLRQIIKNIKQFYVRKGTESAYRFLFRLLYRTYIEIYYPKNTLMKASGDLWIQKNTIKVRGLTEKTALLVKNCIIYQKKSNNTTQAYARITEVVLNDIPNENIYELTLSNISSKFGIKTDEENWLDYIKGILGETVYVDIQLDDADNTIELKIVPVIDTIDFTSGGFSVGDTIVIPNRPVKNETGDSYLALVTKIQKPELDDKRHLFISDLESPDG